MNLRIFFTLGVLVIGLTQFASGGHINPFTSNGELGSFNPTSDVVFHTTVDTWTVTGVPQSGGHLTLAGFGDIQSQYAFYNFTDTSIFNGVRVTVDQTAPLILLAQPSAVIDGIVDMSGAGGGGVRGIFAGPR